MIYDIWYMIFDIWYMIYNIWYIIYYILYIILYIIFLDYYVLLLFFHVGHGHGQGASRLPLLEGVADGFGSSGEDFGQGPLFFMRRAISELGHLCLFQSYLAVYWIYYTQTHAKAWFSAGLRKWRNFISSWSFGPNLSKWRDMRYILSCSVVAFLIQEYIQGNLQIRTSWILSSPWMWPSWVLHDVAI